MKELPEIEEAESPVEVDMVDAGVRRRDSILGAVGIDADAELELTEDFLLGLVMLAL